MNGLNLKKTQIEFGFSIFTNIKGVDKEPHTFNYKMSDDGNPMEARRRIQGNAAEYRNRVHYGDATPSAPPADSMGGPPSASMNTMGGDASAATTPAAFMAGPDDKTMTLGMYEKLNSKSKRKIEILEKMLAVLSEQSDKHGHAINEHTDYFRDHEDRITRNERAIVVHDQRISVTDRRSCENQEKINKINERLARFDTKLKSASDQNESDKAAFERYQKTIDAKNTEQDRQIAEARRASEKNASSDDSDRIIIRQSGPNLMEMMVVNSLMGGKGGILGGFFI